MIMKQNFVLVSYAQAICALRCYHILNQYPVGSAAAARARARANGDSQKDGDLEEEEEEAGEEGGDGGTDEKLIVKVLLFVYSL